LNGPSAIDKLMMRELLDVTPITSTVLAEGWRFLGIQQIFRISG
jgi:hypothetical protein